MSPFSNLSVELSVDLLDFLKFKMLPPGSRQFDRQFDSSSLDNLLATSQKSWLLTICRTYWVPVVEHFLIILVFCPLNFLNPPLLIARHQHKKRKHDYLTDRQIWSAHGDSQKIKSVSVKSVCRSVREIFKKSNRSTDSSTDRFENGDTLLRYSSYFQPLILK